MNPLLLSQIRRAQPRRQVVKAAKIHALPKAELERLKLTPKVHLATIQAGLGDENKFVTIAFRVLVAKLMAEHLAPASKGHVDQIIYPALTALWRVGDRAKRLGKVGVSGDDLRILEEALAMADDVHDICMRREALAAYKAVQGMVGSLDLTMKTLEPYRPHA